MTKLSRLSTALPSGAEVWRLLPPLALGGEAQMALDRELLNQQVAHSGAPTLRFYTWVPLAISLGYHQRHWPPHWDSLQWQGQSVALVRRPSGGRAVLHQGDLTYAIALPLGRQRRQDSYRLLCDGLIAGWRTLGVRLDYGTAGRGYIHRPDCFGTATGADLVTPEGYKLIGSAQLRRGHALLQHGSMRLWPDPDLTGQVFGQGLPPWSAPDWLQAAVAPEQRQAVLGQIAATLSAAIASALQVTFQPSPLTSREEKVLARVGTLLQSCPSNPAMEFLDL